MMLPLLFYLASLGVVGIIGNTVSLLFYSQPAQWSSTICFIVGLSTVDLSISITIFCDFADQFLGFIDHTDVGCKFMTFVLKLQITMSLLIFWIISVDRYKKVCTPSKINWTTKQASVTLFILSLFATFISLPSIFVYESQNIKRNDTIKPDHILCLPSDTQPLTILRWTSYCTDGFVVLGIFCTLVFTYGRIAHVIKMKNLNLKRHNNPSDDFTSRKGSCERIGINKSKIIENGTSLEVSNISNYFKQTRNNATLPINTGGDFEVLDIANLDRNPVSDNVSKRDNLTKSIVTLDRKSESFVVLDRKFNDNPAVCTISEIIASMDTIYEDIANIGRKLEDIAAMDTVPEKIIAVHTTSEGIADIGRNPEDTAAMDTIPEDIVSVDTTSKDNADIDRNRADIAATDKKQGLDGGDTSLVKAQSDVKARSRTVRVDCESYLERNESDFKISFTTVRLDREASLERTLTFITFFVTVIFLLCILPFFIVEIGNFRLEGNRNNYEEIAWRSVYLSCVSDSVILLGFNPNFRRRFIQCTPLLTK